MTSNVRTVMYDHWLPGHWLPGHPQKNIPIPKNPQKSVTNWSPSRRDPIFLFVSTLKL
jgi:hypothetical protein